MSEDRDQRTDKRELRRVMKRLRAEAQAKNPQASFSLRDVFLKAVPLPAGAVIAGYVAQNSEINPYPLMEALHRQGHRLCLPVTGNANEPLTFRTYAPGDALSPAGTPPIPQPAVKAAVAEPDVLIVPLLAFDSRGHRLGYGLGHYDRTITSLRTYRKILAVGVGFDCQHVDEMPAGPHDAVLDKVATETKGYLSLPPS